MSKLQYMKNSKAFRNSIWLMSGRVFQMATSLIVSIFTARYLGPSNYGLITYAASIVAIFSVFAGLGLENIVVNQLVKKTDGEGTIIGSALIMRFISGMLSVIGVTLLVFILNQDNSLLIAITFISSFSLIFRAFDLIEYWYQYKLKSRNAVICKSIGVLVMSGYKILLLVYAKSVIYFAFSSLLESIVTGLLLLLYFFNKNKDCTLNFNIYRAKSLIKNSYHFILSGLAIVLYSQFDKIIIESFYSTTEVGLYSTAINVANMWTFVPLALTISFRPVIMRYYDDDRVRYSKYLHRLYTMIFYLGIFVSGFIWFFGDKIVWFLYEDPYMGAVGPLRIFVFSTIFSYLGVARNIWIVSEKNNKFIKYFLLMGAVINISCNLILVKSKGIEGAAISSLITQLFVLFVAPLFFKKTRKNTKILLESIIFKC